LRIAVYADERDNQPKPVELSWEDLTGLLMEPHYTPCAPCPGKTCTSKFGDAWSPVDIPDGLPRREGSVRAVTAAVLDHDHLTRAQVSDVARTVKPYSCILHSTHTHRHGGDDDNCLRLILQISEPVPASQWRTFLAWLIRTLELPADPTCKDLSRLYFLPSAPEGGPAPIAITNPGSVIDVRAVLGTLAALPTPVAHPAPVAPAPLPADVQAALEMTRGRLADIRTDNRHLAKRILDGADVLGPRGGQDHELQRACRLVSSVAEPGLTGEHLVELLRPSLSRADWGGPSGDWAPTDPATLAHLCDEATKKLDRGVEYWAAKKAEEAAKRESDRRATAAALTRALGTAPASPQPDPEPPPGGGGGQPAPAAEYDPLTDAPPPSPETRFDQVSLKEWTRDGVPTGRLAKDPANVFLWLTHDPAWLGAIRLNSVTQEIELRGRTITDSDLTAIRNQFAHDDPDGALRFPTGVIAEQVALVADRNRYDPIHQYLECLQWDGVERLATWAHDFLGVSYTNDVGDDITAYVQAVSRRWMIGAVARAASPGCKMDTVLILEGPQGLKKSSALKVLGGAWFSDDAGNVIGDKDSKQLISRVWIQELPELDAMRKAEVSSLKAWFSRSEDFYRAPYARTPQRHPRRVVFAGTTNPDTYLLDETGNRRYWPLKCTAIDLGALAAARDQLWAEAAHLYRSGEKWWLTPEESALAAIETSARMVLDDVWSERLLRWWLAQGKPAEVSTYDAMRGLGFTDDRMEHSARIRVGTALKQVGFVKRQKRAGEGRSWVYVPNARLQALPLPDKTGPNLTVVK
jgi:hypothetical protein